MDKQAIFLGLTTPYHLGTALFRFLLVVGVMVPGFSPLSPCRSQTFRPLSHCIVFDVCLNHPYGNSSADPGVLLILALCSGPLITAFYFLIVLIFLPSVTCQKRALTRGPYYEFSISLSSPWR